MQIEHDATLSIATANSRKSSYWKNSQIKWSEFLEIIATPIRTNELLNDYFRMEKQQQDEIKDVGGYVFGFLSNNKRRNGHVKTRQVLTLDADSLNSDVWSMVDMLYGCAAAMYTTHKHQSEAPRIRLLIPLSRPVNAVEYEAISRKVADTLDLDSFDPTTFQPHRLMYWPSVSNDGEFLFEYLDAPFLTPDEVLNEYKNYEDRSEWPFHKNENEAARRSIQKQGNPLLKNGIVGVFCRTFTIQEAIAEFLPDVYEQVSEDRYTYIGASTSAGLVIYDDVFAYSHHSTDPISGKTCNAFDLVRLHQFGHLDEGQSGQGNNLPSFSAMTNFAQSIDSVKLELAKQSIVDAANDFSEELDEEQLTDEVDFRKELKMRSRKDGIEVECTTENIMKIIERHYGYGLAYDTFTNREVRTVDFSWHIDPGEKLKDGETIELTNNDINNMIFEIERLYNFNLSVSKTRLMIESVIHKRTQHVVRDYIKSLNWDGTPRIETLLHDYLGAADNLHNREVMKSFLVAMVKRVFEPGCKYDYMLILIGPQGVGKSTFARKLAGKNEWFSDSLASFDPKKAAEILSGIWVAEIGELAVMRKSEVETVKRFVSSQRDRFRGAYKAKAEDVPRQCVFIGTSNDAEFLSDTTGNRRFLCVDIRQTGHLKKDVFKLNKSEIEQIHAEAYELYKAGYKVELSAEVEELAKQQQDAHMQTDLRMVAVENYLNTPIPIEFDKWERTKRLQYLTEVEPVDPETFKQLTREQRLSWLFDTVGVPSFSSSHIEDIKLPDRISVAEVASEALRIELTQSNRVDSLIVGGLLRQLGYKQTCRKNTKAYGQKIRAYTKE